MMNADLSRRRLLLAAAAGLTVPLVAEMPAFADDANIRRLIVTTAESEINAVEAGDNYYPKHYKVNSQIIRPAEWCGVFVYYCWHVGGATAKPTMDATKGDKQGHWATYWQSWAKSKSRWSPDRANPGDAVVYGNFSQSGHIGIVVEVQKNSNGTVKRLRTVEGNSEDKVNWHDWRTPGSMYVTRKGERRYVSGYARPV